MAFKPEEEISEKDFASNGSKKNPQLIGIFLLGFIVIVGVLWALGSWQQRFIAEKKQHDPFLRVTNRQFSLFLWQNPEYMRANVKSRTGYLDGFRSYDNIHVIPEMAEALVTAPLEIIFRYHVWKRLIGNWVAERPIMGKEFSEFLEDCSEWQPDVWSRNHITSGEFNVPPHGYVDMVKRLVDLQDVNLQTLPLESLPLDVRLAFQGWKNFFKEGDKINELSPDFAQMNLFLRSYPHYQRSYWRNILLSSLPNYLISYLENDKNKKGEIPKEEFSPFLRVGVYNFLHSQLEEPSSSSTQSFVSFPTRLIAKE